MLLTKMTCLCLYLLFRDMDHEAAPASWKKFYVDLAGKTNGAHQAVIDHLKAVGQTEVMSVVESDYRLVFCPTVTRVGTDISEALENVPGGKPVILVVMHHTFDPSHVVAESRKLVNNNNVRLTVDTLFYHESFLRSDRNDIALFEIRDLLGAHPPQGSQFWICARNGLGNNWRMVCLAVASFGAVVALTVLIIKLSK